MSGISELESVDFALLVPSYDTEVEVVGGTTNVNRRNCNSASGHISGDCFFTRSAESLALSRIVIGFNFTYKKHDSDNVHLHEFNLQFDSHVTKSIAAKRLRRSDNAALAKVFHDLDHQSSIVWRSTDEFWTVELEYRPADLMHNAMPASSNFGDAQAAYDALRAYLFPADFTGKWHKITIYLSHDEPRGIIEKIWHDWCQQWACKTTSGALHTKHEAQGQPPPVIPSYLLFVIDADIFPAFIVTSTNDDTLQTATGHLENAASNAASEQHIMDVGTVSSTASIPSSILGALHNSLQVEGEFNPDLSSDMLD